MSTGTMAPGTNPLLMGEGIPCRSQQGRSYTSLSAPYPGLEGLQPVPPTFPWLPLHHHPTLVLANLHEVKKCNGKVLRREVWKNQECFLKPWLV